MRFPMYVIKDIKSHCMTPTVDTNDMTAKRNFAFAIQNPESVMNYSPRDFVLYRIGEYDNERGEITGYDPVVICRGEDVVNE